MIYEIISESETEYIFMMTGNTCIEHFQETPVEEQEETRLGEEMQIIEEQLAKLVKKDVYKISKFKPWVVRYIE